MNAMSKGKEKEKRNEGREKLTGPVRHGERDV